MVIKKILWTLKRHPFLYTTRFKLLSKNTNVSGIIHDSYNVINLKKDMPTYFLEVNQEIFKDGRPQSDLETLKILNSWLRKHIKVGPGLSEPSEKALRIMLNGQGGVCSDMVQIFNNFCVLNDMQVREWGVTFAPYDSDYGGHSFNEVFIEEYQKWIMVDVSYCMLFYNNENEPLSVLEFYQLVRHKGTVSYKPFLNGVYFEKKSFEKNYFNLKAVPFLITNYSNKIYDSYLKKYKAYLPVFVIHFMLFLLNKSYRYKFPLDDYNRIFLKV